MKNIGTLKVTTPTDREIVLTRVFDAPRHLVFDAFSKPELLRRWFGPRGWSLVVCEVDLKVGGGFRFVLRGPDGKEMGMRGVYREIVPPERSVHMESYDDYPGESQVTAVFVEQGGKTTLNATVLYPSREVRDAVIKSAGSTARRRATTSWRSCWRRQRLARWRAEQEGHERNARTDRGQRMCAGFSLRGTSVPLLEFVHFVRKCMPCWHFMRWG